MIDEETVKRIASLARLDLEPGEVLALRKDMERILEHVSRLDAAPPTEEADFWGGGEGGASLREDVVRPSLDRETVLRVAPSRTADSFKVPFPGEAT